MTVSPMVPSGSFSLTEAGNDPSCPFLDIISPGIDLHPLPDHPYSLWGHKNKPFFITGQLGHRQGREDKGKG